MSSSPLPTTSATAPTSSSKTTSTGGWMERKAGKVGFTKRWKRHYFAMEANSLVEYPDVQGGGLSKFYPFSQISDILIEDISKFIFSFRFRKRPHDHANVKLVLFRVPTSEELQEWVSKLRVAVMQASDPPTSTASAVVVPLTPAGATSPSLRDRKGSLIPAPSTPDQNTLPRRESAEMQASAPVQQLHARGTSVLFDDEDATGGSDLEEDDSSDSDSDGGVGTTDYHFSGASTPTSQAPNWGTRMKRFLSRSAWDDEIAPAVAAAEGDDADKGSFSAAAETIPPTQYDLRTFQVIEYDLVEVFENQRWFPIGGWTAKKSLLSDRAHFTSRHGHNRASLFRAGADANEATSGNEDRHEIPGTQVHVIKEPWEWDSQQWVLQPLIGMQRDTSPRNGGAGMKRKQSLDSDEGHRAVMSDSALDTAVPVVASAGVGGAKAPWMKKPFHRLSTTNRPPSSSVLQPAMSDIAVTTNHNNNTTALTSSTSMIVEDNGQSDSTWSLGFDFTDFDHAIARGVPKKHPPLMTSNVRCRRWVRLRKRVVNITARLPENDELAFKLFPSIVSYQRQVICEGWLGTNIRRVWKSRYLKLVRICEGSWDDGEGRGMVQRAPLAIQLICYECKERCNVNFEGIATFTLEPDSVARPAVANLEKATSLLHDSSAVTHSLTLTKNRFVRAPSTSPQQQQQVVLDGSEESSFQMLSVLEDPNWTLQVTAQKMEKPRSGRFEFAVNRDKSFIFSADSSEDSLIWVNALNRAAQEIKMTVTAAASAAAPATAPDTAAKGKKNIFTLVKNIRHHRHVMESDSDVESGAQGADAALGNSGKLEIELEDMVAAPPSLSIDLKQSSAFSNQGKLKEWEDFEMKCTLQQFFTLFYGNGAKYSMKNHHEDMGDFDFNAQPWTVSTESKFPKDEFDFDGFDQVPERLLQLQSYTKSPVGASVTRVEKHQRYYYYPQDNMLFVKSTTRSLDVPFGDSFAVYERWVITSDPADLTKVRVRIYLEAIFSKPAGFIGTTIKRLIHVQIPKNYLQWKKRALAVIKAAAGGPASAAGNEGAGGGDEDAGGAAEEGESLVKKMLPLVEAIWNERVAIGQVVFVVYLMWWMHAMLLVMARLAEALDANHK